jgi:glutamyl-tRNA synthetase
VVPYLHRAGLVTAASFADLGPREQEVLTAAAPLVQERIGLLGEAVGMLGFLLVDDAVLVVEDDARGALKGDAGAVLEAAATALAEVEGFAAADLQAALTSALVDGLGLKPRVAFTPLRVAVSGRRVSPPLFESMEILGRDATLARIAALRATL